MLSKDDMAWVDKLLDYVWEASPHNKQRIFPEAKATITRKIVEARIDEVCRRIAGENWEQKEIDLAIKAGIFSQYEIDRLQALKDLLEEE